MKKRNIYAFHNIKNINAFPTQMLISFPNGKCTRTTSFPVENFLHVSNSVTHNFESRLDAHDLTVAFISRFPRFFSIKFMTLLFPLLV